MSVTLKLDPIRCDGHGYCAEILPEIVHLDDWGFPMLSKEPVPDALLEHAERAVKTCPVLALRLQAHR